jgi:RNA-directed DNA polymerase
MKTKLNKTYQDIICLENLFAAWQEFVCGKRKKPDVQEFGLNLTENIFDLHQSLANLTYAHGPYKAFKISDPKPRDIHKAQVKDRVLHHAIYRQLYPFFDKIFIEDSYSCRIGKGTYKALSKFRLFGRRLGKNHTRTVWVLKCDIKKFFASIDHKILLEILDEYIPDKNIFWLLKQIIESFSIRENCSAPIYRHRECLDLPINGHATQSGTGLPLGNLTSQLFCNVYLNKLDQFAKHKLKAKCYVRYADDFVFLSANKMELLNLIPKISNFLAECLKLRLHPNKIFLKSLASGVDFLGWVNFPLHSVLRSATKRRMFKGLRKNPKDKTLQSYLGLLSHGNSFGLSQNTLNVYGLLSDK